MVHVFTTIGNRSNQAIHGIREFPEVQKCNTKIANVIIEIHITKIGSASEETVQTIRGVLEKCDAAM